MMVSEISVATAKEFLRIDDDDPIIAIILSAAKSYIKSYTGLDDERIDTHEDITTALLVLCSDMYENRLMTVDNDKVNRVVQSILDMHCQNLL